jgi:hypothetical protein
LGEEGAAAVHLEMAELTRSLLLLDLRSFLDVKRRQY